MGTPRCSRSAEGVRAAGPSPARPSGRARPKLCQLCVGNPHSPGNTQDASQPHQNLCCPAPRDREAASTSGFAPSFTISCLKNLCKAFFPSSSKCPPTSPRIPASSSTEQHRAMPPSPGLAVLRGGRGGDGHPPSAPAGRRVPLPALSHPDGRRGRSSPVPPSPVPAEPAAPGFCHPNVLPRQELPKDSRATGSHGSVPRRGAGGT